MNPVDDRATLPWPGLFLIVALGLVIRLAFYNGPFGSDDGTYFLRAQEIAHGTWTPADYNGALRFGFNVPAGLLMKLFGDSIVMANLWPLLCSLSELLAVGWMASTLFGARTGLLAAALLALTPLHIAVATRIHADPVVSAALTWGVVLCYQGLRRQSAPLLFGAGLALGGVYWAKELAAVCYFGLLPLLWFFRARLRDLLWVLGGLLVMLVLNGMLFLWVAGDPLHGVHVVLRQLRTGFVHGGGGRDDAGYYLPYFFVDLRHVALLGWLALLGLARLALSKGTPRDGGAAFVAAWLLGILVVLSVFPVSLNPLRFTMKQSNYLTLLLAPLSVCAAVGLASLGSRPWLARAVIGIAAVLGVGLAALQQADYRAFTSISKAMAQEARETRRVYVGSVNNSRLAAELAVTGEPAPRVLSWAEAQAGAGSLESLAGPADFIYVVLDPRTRDWPSAGSGPAAALACWEADGEIAPVDLGLGNYLAAALAHLSTTLHMPGGVQRKLHDLGDPSPALRFKLRAGRLQCADGAARNEGAGPFTP